MNTRRSAPLYSEFTEEIYQRTVNEVIPYTVIMEGEPRTKDSYRKSDLKEMARIVHDTEKIEVNRSGYIKKQESKWRKDNSDRVKLRKEQENVEGLQESKK